MRLKLIFATVVVVLLAFVGWWLFGGPPRGEVGSVSTNFRWLGPNDKIAIDGFDDPDIDGVACHISRPERGGVSGALGTAEDPSDVAIACRQIGPIVFRNAIKDGTRVFDERRSLIFKTMNVVRFFDAKRNVLVYVAYSDRVVSGSPKNSISTVPLMAWNGIAAKTM
ncbi:MAG: CreA family protein [Rhodospirillales bacterium]|nr:CreA family protein [Rhodospirillales bacterium]